MHTPLRITFQNTPSSDAIRQLIEEQADHLEQFFGRMTACHVVFKVPDGNHRSSGLYEVTVHIKMPGGTTVDIDRTPGLDERFCRSAVRRQRRLPPRAPPPAGSRQGHAAGGEVAAQAHRPHARPARRRITLRSTAQRCVSKGGQQVVPSFETPCFARLLRMRLSLAVPLCQHSRRQHLFQGTPQVRRVGARQILRRSDGSPSASPAASKGCPVRPGCGAAPPRPADRTARRARQGFAPARP